MLSIALVVHNPGTKRIHFLPVKKIKIKTLKRVHFGHSSFINIPVLNTGT